MGEAETEANIQLGRDIAQFADYAILNSSRGAHIKKGCLEGGMNAEKILLTSSLNEAMERVSEIQGKKVILFENDLPDNLK
ncbi:MAG: hypothetical protein FWH03_03770 [Firmicutes bacterium]|nr:hypothetical protein [Bacillota bacterium]